MLKIWLINFEQKEERNMIEWIRQNFGLKSSGVYKVHSTRSQRRDRAKKMLETWLQILQDQTKGQVCRVMENRIGTPKNNTLFSHSKSKEAQSEKYGKVQVQAYVERRHGISQCAHSRSSCLEFTCHLRHKVLCPWAIL